MASSSNSNITLPCSDDALIDDFYFSALFDHDDMFPISDEKYAHELHFQEALISSAVANYSQIVIDEEEEEKEEEENNNISKRPNREIEISDLSPILCMICMEPKPYTDIFKNNTCSCDNSYCSDCISKHIAVKIQENISMVNCPSLNCRGVLQPELCQSIIPKQVFERWEDALCESLILASKRIYCPLNDCSALLIDDGDVTVTQAECPSCKRLFCAQCMVTWHSEIECDEFQRLGKNDRGHDDLMAMELAKNNKWRRCPNCRYYVEKRDGCLRITCRCRYEFCYGCGVKWTSYSHQCRMP